MRLVLFVLSEGVVFVSLVLSLISAAQPHWIQQTTATASPVQLTSVYGLFEKCDQSILDSTEWICRKFPKVEADCRRQQLLPPVHPSGIDEEIEEYLRDDIQQLLSNMSFKQSSSQVPPWAAETSQTYSSFCSYWRLAGYFSQLSIAFGAASLLSLLVVQGGGRRRRRSGWPLCAALTSFHAASQICTFAIVAHAYRNDSRFRMGSSLGWCFFASLLAWGSNVVLAFAMIGTGLAGQWEIPQRKGYTPIPDEIQ